MKNFLTIIVLAALAFGAYVWLTPYFTVQKLVDALEQEDTARVDQYVDFAAVQASFENDFAASMGLDSGEQDTIGAILATRIAGAFIGSIVSPETMVHVLKDHDRRERLGLSDDLGDLTSRGQWVNKDQFVLHDSFNKPTMLLQRKGLKWEVTAISLK